MRLDLVVGPNGSGKSTFVELVIAPRRPGVPFVNADVIAAREPFIAETVFSHPSKLDLIGRARAAGYSVALHVLLTPEDLAVHRVEHRVAAGGHPVPEDKIRGRYARLWPLVAAGIVAADTAHVYDNSQVDGPQDIASFAYGFPDGPCHWPAWTPSALAGGWPTQT